MIWSPLTWFTPPPWSVPQTPLLELCHILVLFPTLLSPVKLNTAEFLLKTIRTAKYFLLYSKIPNFPHFNARWRAKSLWLWTGLLLPLLTVLSLCSLTHEPHSPSLAFASVVPCALKASMVSSLSPSSLCGLLPFQCSLPALSSSFSVPHNTAHNIKLQIILIIIHVYCLSASCRVENAEQQPQS